jgi:hypothetical protein
VESIGQLIKLRSGKWVIQYKEGFYPHFYTSLFNLVPWMEVEEDSVTEFNTIVAFRPVLLLGQLYAEIQ